MALDYYKVLGVSRTASEGDVRKAYKKIARENHPDVKPNDPAAAERFKQASEAYEVLSDAEKRKQYDQFGSAWKHARKGGPYPGGGPFGGGQQSDFDFGDIFGQGGGAVDLGDLFGGMFGGGRAGRGRAQPRQSRGQDIQTSVTVPFDLAATGGSYDLHLSRNGQTETLGVKIPQGLRDGGTIRLAGQGEPGQGGGAAGDLLVTVHFASHPYFRREGNDVYVDVPLTIAEAALGAKVDVPTLTEGLLMLTIPAGSSSGAKLRLKGKGFIDPRSKQQGDQYAVVKIVPPKSLDDESRRLIEEFAERNPDQPRRGLW
jgi:DnaJ-class molecular chaperone